VRGERGCSSPGAAKNSGQKRRGSSLRDPEMDELSHSKGKSFVPPVVAARGGGILNGRTLRKKDKEGNTPPFRREGEDGKKLLSKEIPPGLLHRVGRENLLRHALRERLEGKKEVVSLGELYRTARRDSGGGLR